MSFKRSLFDAEVKRLLDKAEDMIPDQMLPDLPYMKLAPHVHEWYAFESKLWSVGEEIRQTIQEYKMTFNKEQTDRIIKICLDKKAKRGRQSFIMLLGKKAYGQYSNELISVLNDADVDGHVIYTVYKMQEGQYIEEIKSFLNHKNTWIKNEAKKYVEKFERS
ncbi:MAG: hypothetical protein IJD14_04105 [Christensenellaceae bacterium]|nr:hypothetical protein [Christensenellaceae bacterium]